MRLRTLSEIGEEMGVHTREVSTACRLLGIETSRIGPSIVLNDEQYLKLRPYLERLRAGFRETMPAAG